MRMQYVETILDNLGAGKFIIQTGAHSFKDGLESGQVTLYFRIHGTVNQKGSLVDAVKIKLTHPMTYTMEFGQFWGGQYNFVADREYVHQSQLRDVFMEYTGIILLP